MNMSISHCTYFVTLNITKSTSYLLPFHRQWRGRGRRRSFRTSCAHRVGSLLAVVRLFVALLLAPLLPLLLLLLLLLLVVLVLLLVLLLLLVRLLLLIGGGGLCGCRGCDGCPVTGRECILQPSTLPPTPRTSASTPLSSSTPWAIRTVSPTVTATVAATIAAVAAGTTVAVAAAMVIKPSGGGAFLRFPRSLQTDLFRPLSRLLLLPRILGRVHRGPPPPGGALGRTSRAASVTVRVLLAGGKSRLEPAAAAVTPQVTTAITVVGSTATDTDVVVTSAIARVAPIAVAVAAPTLGRPGALGAKDLCPLDLLLLLPRPLRRVLHRLLPRGSRPPRGPRASPADP